MAQVGKKKENKVASTLPIYSILPTLRLVNDVLSVIPIITATDCLITLNETVLCTSISRDYSYVVLENLTSFFSYILFSGSKCERISGMDREETDEVTHLQEELSSILDTQCPLRDSLAEVNSKQEAVSFSQLKLEDDVREINASSIEFNETLSQVRTDVSDVSNDLLKIQEDIMRLQLELAELREERGTLKNTTAKLQISKFIFNNYFTVSCVQSGCYFSLFFHNHLSIDHVPFSFKWHSNICIS